MTQLTLRTEWVELTVDEKADRGQRLADLLRQRRLIVEEHKDRKVAMKQELEAIDAEILAMEDVVRTGREERPKG